MCIENKQKTAHEKSPYLCRAPGLISNVFCFLHIVSNEEVVKNGAGLHLRHIWKYCVVTKASFPSFWKVIPLVLPATDQDQSRQSCQTYRCLSQGCTPGYQSQDAPRLPCSWGCQSAWVSTLPAKYKVYFDCKGIGYFDWKRLEGQGHQEQKFYLATKWTHLVFRVGDHGGFPLSIHVLVPVLRFLCIRVRNVFRFVPVLSTSTKQL